MAARPFLPDVPAWCRGALCPFPFSGAHMTSPTLAALENPSEFVARHIGLSATDESHMLSAVGVASRAALMDAIVPATIRRAAPMGLPPATTAVWGANLLAPLVLWSRAAQATSTATSNQVRRENIFQRRALRCSWRAANASFSRVFRSQAASLPCLGPKSGGGKVGVSTLGQSDSRK